MTEEVRACLGVVCQALQVKAVSAADLVVVEAWTGLPRFSLPRFRLIVEQTCRERGRISSVRYFDPIITEAFCPPPGPGLPPRPRLLAEREWPDYRAYLAAIYGEPDGLVLSAWRDKWELQRCRAGLPREETDESPDPLP